jgi:hypothetical protein
MDKTKEKRIEQADSRWFPAGYSLIGVGRHDCPSPLHRHRQMIALPLA